MDPLALYRLLRRRWIVLVVCMAVGAGVGYASTLLGSDDDEPVVTYWTAGQVLIVDSGADVQLNLVRLGPEAVLGAIPAQLAAEFGVEPAQLGLRSVADASGGTLTISAVSVEDPAAARAISAAVAEAFIDSIVVDDIAAYDRQVQLLQTETRNQQQRIDEAQAEIDQLNERSDALAEGETLAPAQQDRLSRAFGTRTNAEGAFAAAAEALEALVIAGPPAAPLSVLQEVTPTRISEAAYDQRISQAGQAANTFTSGIEADATATASAASRLESPIMRAMLGAFAGLLLGIMLVVVQARLDTRLRDRAGFEAAFALPVIAEVPSMKRSDRKGNVLHAMDQPYSQITEAHRYIRSVLLFARATQEQPAGRPSPSGSSTADAGVDARDVRVIMVTSANAGEGKTTTAANLAVMMAEAGYQTLLVNCDHRRPRMHEMFDVPYTPGTISDTLLPSLHLITDVPRAENDSPSRIAEHQRNVIRNARAQVDVVILDTAPILATNDALDLAAETDLVILVARAGSTTSAAAIEARELLVDRMGVPVTGVVVTGATGGFGGRYYAANGYYGVDPSTTSAAATAANGMTAATAPATVPSTPAAPAPAATGAEPPRGEPAAGGVTSAHQQPLFAPDDDPAAPAQPVEHWLDQIVPHASRSTRHPEDDNQVIDLRPGNRTDDVPEARRGLRG